MSDKSTRAARTFGIGAVARLTGLSDHTIRVWERRYGAVSVGRAGNGRRLYTESDVERLSLLKALTDSGLAISRVANEPDDELRRRLASLDVLSETPGQQTVRVAVLGDLLPGEMRAAASTDGVEIVAADASEDRLAADAARSGVDVLVVELPVASHDTRKRLQLLRKRCGADRSVVVYRFAKAADIERLRGDGTVLLRGPASADDVTAAVRRVRTVRRGAGKPKGSAPKHDMPSAWRENDAVPARRFTRDQLAVLAQISSTVECECPKHLTHLINDLSAFEVYSEQCSNRDDDDAALHRYLHRTTASARALLEESLERVLKAEGIEV